MKEITLKFTVYEFDELSNEAKDYACQQTRMSDFYMDWEWWDCVYADFKQEFKKIGIVDPEFYFSLAYCQGDYAELRDCEIDVETAIKSAGIKIRHNLHDLFCNSTAALSKAKGGVYVDVNNYVYNCPYINDYFDKIADELDKYLTTKIAKLERKLYRALQDEYESMRTDESIAEYHRDNETLFYEDGRVFTV